MPLRDGSVAHLASSLSLVLRRLGQRVDRFADRTGITTRLRIIPKRIEHPLDSSVAAFYLKGHFRAAERIEQPGRWIKRPLYRRCATRNRTG
jgi:hypothetical protein